MTYPKTDTKTLIEALRILANNIQSADGIANATISEAADRLEELTNRKPDWWFADDGEKVRDPEDYLDRGDFYEPCLFNTAFEGPSKWCVLLPKLTGEYYGEVLCCDTLEDAEAACEERCKAMEAKR